MGWLGVGVVCLNCVSMVTIGSGVGNEENSFSQIKLMCLPNTLYYTFRWNVIRVRKMMTVRLMLMLLLPPPPLMLRLLSTLRL